MQESDKKKWFMSVESRMSARLNLSKSIQFIFDNAKKVRKFISMSFRIVGATFKFV